LPLTAVVIAFAGQAVKQKGAGQYCGHIDFSISPPFRPEKSGDFSGNPI